MNKLNNARRAQIIACLCVGMSVRATCRVVGADKKTVLRLLEKVGEACLEYHDVTVRNLQSKRIQADEIWSFCYAKAKNVPAEKKGQFGYGDVWTWSAMDADSTLMVSWFVGGRDAGAAFELMSDCAAVSPTACSSPRTATGRTCRRWKTSSAWTSTMRSW